MHETETFRYWPPEPLVPYNPEIAGCLEQGLKGIVTTGVSMMDAKQAPDRKIDTCEDRDTWLSTYPKIVGLEFVLIVIFISLGYISGNNISAA